MAEEMSKKLRNAVEHANEENPTSRNRGKTANNKKSKKGKKLGY